MRARTSMREVWIGLLVIGALAGLLGLVGLASDGPGFLAPQKTINVIFRDGQGIRVGSPVRIAGLDAGNVVDLSLVEVEGSLRAQVRLSLPTSLLKKLKQDVKVTIAPGLTGMSHVNVVASGRSDVALVPGQTIQGVESSFFDPIIEQVGLGPQERNHLSHTIAEVRQTVDSVGPRLRQILASFEDASGNVKEMSDSLRPAVEATVGHVEDLTRRIGSTSPRIEATITRLDVLTRLVELMLSENRDNVRLTVASVKDLTGSAKEIVTVNRPKVEKVIEGVDMLAARSNRVMYQADVLANQAVQIVTTGRSDIERSISNVRDATDWADKLVQKIYTNPFVLSPFYKPSNEDLRVQTVYDTAQVFSKGAQELHDAAKTLDSMQTRPTSPEQQQEVARLQQQVLALTESLGKTSQSLAEGLKRPATTGRVRR
ncbi:MAG: MlaD family protein [Paludisphaera borealis]|uniref:MlaD family protein n=1 Tax=Paludisphaera borealis TaxID=1387353 RepID=UPI00283ECC1A|nr:MlaD family protein [Paludisphaera borealis]MDR3618987.1 MlaD family protein [Paludisphaera borealis]